MDRLLGAIAATRFGMGARPGEIEAASGDPRGWLKAQIRADAALMRAGSLKSSDTVLRERKAAYADKPGKPGRQSMAAAGGADMPTDDQARAVIEMVQRDIREGLGLEIEARSRHSAVTPDSFADRWVRFWSNHFTVAARNAQMIGLVGPFEREAIRPFVFGSFSGLLASTSLHPAMLVYLDAHRSIGPSTRPARRRDAGLNENLAREILELHTLGVGAGYTQEDIIELAKALTGWTVDIGGASGLGKLAGSQTGGAVFASPLHEPGARTVLGKSYRGEGRQQAPAILADLAVHPATARHVATKLARHFTSDDPPSAAVARLEDAFIQSRGDLAALARAVVDLDEAWRLDARKFKTPEELLVSVSRFTGDAIASGREVNKVYQSLGQTPFRAPSPAGWADDAPAWSGADAIRKRLDWANALSRRMGRTGSPLDLLDAALGPLAGERTRQSVSRAESAEQGFTLAIMSPEFQRR